MFKLPHPTTVDAGFAQGFLETTQAYLAVEPVTTASAPVQALTFGGAPLPVIERGLGPRAPLHLSFAEPEERRS